MIVNTSSKFQREFSEVVKNVMLPSLLSYIAKPLVFFKPIRTNVFPEQWEAGDYLVRMYLFYFIPFGEQTIRIELLKSKVEIPNTTGDPKNFISKIRSYISKDVPSNFQSFYTSESIFNDNSFSAYSTIFFGN